MKKHLILLFIILISVISCPQDEHVPSLNIFEGKKFINKNENYTMVFTKNQATLDKTVYYDTSGDISTEFYKVIYDYKFDMNKLYLKVVKSSIINGDQSKFKQQLYTKNEYIAKMKELGIEPTEDDIQSTFADRTFRYKVNQTLLDNHYSLILEEDYTNIYVSDFLGVSVEKIGNQNYSVVLSVNAYNYMDIKYTLITDTTSDLTSDIIYSDSVNWNTNNTGGSVIFVSGHFENDSEYGMKFIKEDEITSADFELKSENGTQVINFNFKSGLMNGLKITATYLPYSLYFNKWE